jgi:hypothetical protein
MEARRGLTVIAITLAALSGAGCSCKSTTGGSPDAGMNPDAGGTVTVTGRVLDGRGVAVAGAQVFVGTAQADAGMPLSTTTDGSGSFTLAGVAAPYDVSVLMGKHVVQDVGVTSPAPTLVAVNEAVGISQTAQVSGTIGAPSGAKVSVGFGPPTVLATGSVDPASGGYTLIATWVSPDGGATPVTGSVGAAGSYAPAGGPATGLYGETPVLSLDGGAPVAGENITVQPVALDVITSPITVPADGGWSIPVKAVSLGTASSGQIAIVTDTSGTPSTNYPVPYPDGGTPLLIVYGVQAGGGTSSTLQSYGPPPWDAGISLVPGPVQGSPANGAATVTFADSFTWTGCAGVSQLHVSCTPSGVAFDVLTAASVATLPDLGAAAPRFAPSDSCGWSVTCLAPLAGVDELVGGGSGRFTGGIPDAGSAIQTADSGTWTFTAR